MIKRLLVALAVVVGVLGPAVSASATVYYGPMPGIYSEYGWLGDNPYYWTLSATGRPQPLAVYHQGGDVFAFHDAQTGFEYTDYGPCGAYMCTDSGSIMSPYGLYEITCTGRPGWFSMRSMTTGYWASLIDVAGGWSVYFNYPHNPAFDGYRPGLFYAQVGATGWCGA